MKRSVCVIIPLVLIWLTAPAATATAATVTFREASDVVSSIVCLGDVADISGEERGERIDALRSFTLCSAPPPAESQILTARGIVYTLMASGVDISALEFAGSARVEVRRKHDSISVQELARAFAEHVSARTGWLPDSFLVRPPNNLHAIPVAIGERRILVETDAHEDFQGSVLAHFQIVIDEKLKQTIVHRFDIERSVEALVTVRKIPRGKPLTPSDVALKSIEQSRVAENSLTRVEEVIGLQALRTIKADKVLRKDLLTFAPLVQRGEYKSVISTGNGFKIMTRGRMLENGCAGDVVRVRLESRKIVRAVVLDSKTLRLVGRRGENEAPR